MSRRAGMAAAAAAMVTAVTVVVAGCATSIQGSPGVDPAVASSFATAASSPAGATHSTASTSSSQTPIPPVPPSSVPSTESASVANSDTGQSGAATTGASSGAAGDTVHGISIPTIAAGLADDPVYADADAASAAAPGTLTDLDGQVSAARNAGLDIWVVLIGHDVDGLTDVSDAVASAVGGTAVVVTTTHFAVSSNRFNKDQLGTAEDAAASASSTVQAASVLVDQFRAMAATGGSTRTGTTTGTTGTGTTKAGDLSLSSFQLADHSVGCLITDDTVRCDLMVDHTYTPPKNPNPGCQGDYGSSITMPAGKAPFFGCISDTVYDPHAAVLPDGGDTLVGNVMCFADGPTVTCLNMSDAHGFYLGPDAFSVF